MRGTNIKQRLTYIDIARAIGILFVVLGHVNQFYRDSQGIENSQTLIFIYAFHMPLFFILSGILFSEKTFHDLSFFDFLIKKVKALLVPYLFLDITAGLYETVISSKIQISSIAEVLKNTLTLHCNVGANWFISALFIGEIFLYFFLKYYRYCMDPISYYTSVLSIFNTLDKCFCAWCDCIYFYASGVLLKRLL